MLLGLHSKKIKTILMMKVMMMKEMMMKEMMIKTKLLSIVVSLDVEEVQKEDLGVIRIQKIA